MSATAGTLAGVIEQIADDSPDAIAVIEGETALTFSQLRERIHASELVIDSQTLPEESVAVVGANHRIWVELYYAVPQTGRRLVFLNHRLHESELASMISRSGAGLVVGARAEIDRLQASGVSVRMQSWEEWAKRVDDAAPSSRSRSAVEPETPAWLLFTSGTTAAPKGALLSHANVLAAVQSSASARPVEVDDVYLFPFPLCHVAGYNVVHRHAHGRPVVLMSGFSAPEFCDVVERWNVTSTSLAATMLASLLDFLEEEPHRVAQLTSLRSIAYGAAPMPTPLLRRADAMLRVDFAQGYGMTELSGNAVFLDAHAHRRGLSGDERLLEAAGIAAPGVELRLVDDADQEVADGEIGEVLVQAPQVMIGYLDDPDSTNSALRNGWLHTGDVGRLVDGYLYLVDRKKDIIITGGENVSSLEVEAAVLAHPDVARVAVIGVPDPKWGENVCAVVVPRVGSAFAPESLVAFVRQSLAGFKVPRHVVIVDELPVTASGKVVKAQLRDLILDHPDLVGKRL